MIYTVYTEIERNILSADPSMQLDSDPTSISIQRMVYFLSMFDSASQLVSKVSRSLKKIILLNDTSATHIL